MAGAFHAPAIVAFSELCANVFRAGKPRAAYRASRIARDKENQGSGSRLLHRSLARMLSFVPNAARMARSVTPS